MFGVSDDSETGWELQLFDHIIGDLDFIALSDRSIVFIFHFNPF